MRGSGKGNRFLKTLTMDKRLKKNFSEREKKLCEFLRKDERCGSGIRIGVADRDPGSTAAVASVGMDSGTTVQGALCKARDGRHGTVPKTL